MMGSRIMRWAGNAAHMGEKRNRKYVVGRKAKEKNTTRKTKT
jgi:hypothetical protein